VRSSLPTHRENTEKNKEKQRNDFNCFFLHFDRYERDQINLPTGAPHLSDPPGAIFIMDSPASTPSSFLSRSWSRALAWASPPPTAGKRKSIMMSQREADPADYDDDEEERLVLRRPSKRRHTTTSAEDLEYERTPSPAIFMPPPQNLAHLISRYKTIHSSPPL
jgi:hypothetical protein